MTHLIETLKRMYADPEYKKVDKARIQTYLDKRLITQEEYAYIIGEKSDE